jgi:Flp pilus assembly protein TadG
MRDAIRAMKKHAEFSDAGSTVVELALSIILLMTLIFGIAEFSRALYTYHFISNAAREASRYAIVRGASCSSWASACPASAADIQSYVRSITPEGINPNAVTVTTTWTPNNSPGNLVKVNVQYGFTFDLPFLPLGTMHMASDSQMVISQ